MLARPSGDARTVAARRPETQSALDQVLETRPVLLSFNRRVTSPRRERLNVRDRVPVTGTRPAGAGGCRARATTLDDAGHRAASCCWICRQPVVVQARSAGTSSQDTNAWIWTAVD